MANVFIEKYNIDKLKFLRDIKEDDFVEFFISPEEKDKSGNKVWINKEYKKVQAMANYMIKNKKTSRQVIYTSNKNCDRLFSGSKASFQSMPRRLRAFLARDNYYDMDMVSAAPNIIYYIATEVLKIDSENLRTLKEYASDSKAFQNKNNLEKNDTFKFFFSETGKGKTPFVRNLIEECRLIQKEIWDNNLGYDNNILMEKRNAKGCYTAAVYFKYERMFLDKAMDWVGREHIAAPIHDGFLVDINRMNVVVEDRQPPNFPVKLCWKEFETEYERLTIAYENFLEKNDEAETILFNEINDDWVIKQWKNYYLDFFRIDEDDNIYTRKVYSKKSKEAKGVAWVLDKKNKFLYCSCVDLIHKLEDDQGYNYMNEKDEKAFKKYHNHNSINPVVNKIKNQLHTIVDTFEEETGNYIFFTNGYYDIDMNEFIIDTFDKFNTWYYDFDYNIHHKFTGFTFKNILKDCLGDNYELFLKFLLASLNGYTLKKILYMIGKGHNGKTVIVDTLRHALKDISHIVNGDIFAFDLSVNKPRADLIGLKNKRIIFTSEPPETKLQSSTIKALSGGDNIVCRKLHSNETSEFENNFNILVAANNHPNFEDMDVALIKRYCFMEMKKKYIPNPREGVEEEMKANPYYLSGEFVRSQKKHIIHWLLHENREKEFEFDAINFDTEETLIIQEEMKEDNSPAVEFFSTNTMDCVGSNVDLAELYEKFRTEQPNSHLSKIKFNKDIKKFYKVAFAGKMKRRVVRGYKMLQSTILIKESWLDA